MTDRTDELPAWWRRALSRRDQRSTALTAFVLVLVVAIILSQLGGFQVLLSNTTTTGGDTGAHYMTPHYLDQFLRHRHLTGWFNGWYDGMPLYSYYFILPDLLVAIFSHVIGYNVAFKLATVLGSLLLPLAAWALGHGFRLRRPFPEALAAGMVVFLFSGSQPPFTFMGGNLFSTLAGEYAFSLSIAFALAFLALVASGLRDGRFVALAAVTFALCLAAHLLPALWAVGVCVLLLVFELIARRRLSDDGMGWRRGVVAVPESTLLTKPAAVRWLVAVGALGAGLMAWWWVPFISLQRYANPMGYINVGPSQLLWPGFARWAVVGAAIALVLGIAVRSRFALVFTAAAACSALAVALDPQGSFFDVRLVPFFFLSVDLSVAWLFAFCWVELMTYLRRRRLAAYAKRPAVRTRPKDRLHRPGSLSGMVVAAGLASASVVTQFSPIVNAINNGVLAPVNRVVGTNLSLGTPQNQVANWARYNFAGYENSSSYSELQAVFSMARHLGTTHGCGRAFWQYDPSESRFGTTMALMLLPLETNDCIDTQEGLFFESSASTPYHFLNQSELSLEPSDAMGGLPYQGLNVPDGVKHLQLMGVRYYFASSPSLVALARKDPNLTEVATTGAVGASYSPQTWVAFEVKGSDLVVPLHHLPVVVPGASATASSWLKTSVPWYQDPSRWDVPLAANGPANWPVGTATTSTSPSVVPTSVSDVSLQGGTMSFNVTKLGSPVVVRVSYSPGWSAKGATGPYRITPNLMVVVPTAHHVVLTYGPTTANRVGDGLTFLAIGGCVVVGVTGIRRRRAKPAGRSVLPPSPEVPQDQPPVEG